jgi:predicted oxidoreductase
MPLTQAGKKTLRNFQREYGTRGAGIFYAWIRRHPNETYKMHKHIKHLHIHPHAIRLSIKQHERYPKLDKKLKKIAMKGL